MNSYFCTRIDKDVLTYLLKSTPEKKITNFFKKVCRIRKSNYLCHPVREVEKESRFLERLVLSLEKIKFKNYFKKDLHDKKEVVLLHPL